MKQTKFKAIILYKTPSFYIVDYNTFKISRQIYKLILFSTYVLFFLYFYFSFTIKIEYIFFLQNKIINALLDSYSAMGYSYFEKMKALDNALAFDYSCCVSLSYAEVLFVCCFYAFLEVVFRYSFFFIEHIYITLSKNPILSDILSVIFKI